MKIKQLSTLVEGINSLKEKGVLYTGTNGFFHIYKEVVHAGHNPQALCNNLYLYARAAGLIKKNQELTLIDVDDKSIIATINNNQVIFPAP